MLPQIRSIHGTGKKNPPANKLLWWVVYSRHGRSDARNWLSTCGGCMMSMDSPWQETDMASLELSRTRVTCKGCQKRLPMSTIITIFHSWQRKWPKLRVRSFTVDQKKNSASTGGSLAFSVVCWDFIPTPAQPTLVPDAVLLVGIFFAPFPAF